MSTQRHPAQVRGCDANWSGARRSRRTRARGIRSATACRTWPVPRNVYYAGRAGGRGPGHRHSMKLHEQEQRRLVETALKSPSIEQTMRNLPRLTLNAAGAPVPSPLAGERARRSAARWQGRVHDVEIRVPQLPESVADATLVAWRKQAGQSVSRDENLADLETDKVVLEVPSPVSGVLRETQGCRRRHRQERRAAGADRGGRGGHVRGGRTTAPAARRRPPAARRRTGSQEPVRRHGG